MTSSFASEISAGIAAELTSQSFDQDKLIAVPVGFYLKNDLRYCLLPETDRAQINRRLQTARYTKAGLEAYTRYFCRSRVFIEQTKKGRQIVVVARSDANPSQFKRQMCERLPGGTLFSLVRLNWEVVFPATYEVDGKAVMKAVREFETLAEMQAKGVSCLDEEPGK
ncbi:hypothetical protein [Roseibium suaedae]|uniref:Uncharacterized protein n=1 Tax=Roseibium suaedae TaxID=735517 RepID=A0A1M6YXQ1_9HYPH|nr:hypothetical protein [Roseibium suaedae]SHL22842.1 hypothetical protein SAMN05444272_0065 [Roseibium suaedae]